MNTILSVDGLNGTAHARGMKIGYARVSTADQKLDLQLDALKKAGCEKWFSDVASGSKDERKGLEQALAALRPGDTLVVWKLDRLGRSLPHLIQTVSDLAKMGVDFLSLQESIDTGTPGGRLVFHVFAALAQFERELVRDRTKAGLEAARARGRSGGRPKKLKADQINIAQRLNRDGVPIAQICEVLKISERTYFRYMADASSLEPPAPPKAKGKN